MYFWQQCQSDELATLARHTNAVSAVTVSRNGQWLGSRDVKGVVKIVRIASGAEELSVDAGKGPAPSFSPYFINEDTLLGLSSDELWVYRPPQLQELDARESR